MKKVFLLLTSAMFGVAAMAGEAFSYDESEKTLSIPYNSYGKGYPNNPSIGWQGGGTAGIEILSEAVFDASGNAAWVPAKGETFTIAISGTADMTGVLKFFIVDESEAVDYWGAWSGSFEFNVTEGEAFSEKFPLKISNLTQTDNQKASFGKELSVAALIIGYEMPEGSKYEDSDKAAARTITNASLKVMYTEAIEYEDPYVELEYQGPADKAEDGFKYQSTTLSTAKSAASGKYVNVSFSGKAVSAVSTLMYTLIEYNSGKEIYFNQLNEFITCKSDIKAGETVSLQFSAPLDADMKDASSQLKDVFLAQSTEELPSIVFENYSLEVDVTDQNKYAIPTAVDEVAAADFAIEGGMVYSAGVITVYNVAGQVVATASQEFNVNTLAAGAYFIVAEEGTIKFVK